jgi:HEAT repeat protein
MILRLPFIIFFAILIHFTLLHCEPKTGPAKPMLEDQTEEDITTADLIKNLDSKDVFARSQATIQLGSRREKAAIPKLRLLLNDKEPGVRAGAAIALGDLMDKPSTIAITKLFETDKENPKDVYLDAISRMKDPSAGAKIYKLLDSDDSTLRLQTVEALVQIGAKDQGANIVALAGKNKDREKDKTYAMAIGKLGISAGEKYLLKLTDVQDDSPTLAACYLALGRIKSKSAVPLLVKALKHPYSKGKENASFALIDIRDPKAVSLAFPLLEIDEAETRMYVTDVLSEIPSLEAGERALKYLDSDKKYTWGSAAKIVGRQKYKPGREKIEQMLQIETTPDRDLFAEALGWLGDPKSIPVLRKILVSKSKEGRYGSAWALGILGAKEALPDLQNALNDSDPKLVSYALEAIGAIADMSSLPVLAKLLSDRPKLAPQILSAVGLISGEEARLLIESSAKSDDANVYRPALEEIAKRRSKESIPLLLEFVNSENAEKRKVSYYALAAITGEHYRTKKDWNEWRLKNK